MQRPAFQEGVDDQFVQFLDIVAGNIIGVDDLVEDESGSVVLSGKVSVNLRCQDVIVIIKKCKLLHRTKVDLKNDGAIRSWWRRLPSRWCKEW